MAADRYIAALDRALSRTGEDVVLRRTIGTENQAAVDVTLKGFATTVSASDLVDGVTQDHLKVIISPTSIGSAQWPGGQPAGIPGDPRVPRKGDKLVIGGRERNVDAVRSYSVGGDLVRIELFVAG